jgi:cytochrome c556
LHLGGNRCETSNRDEAIKKAHMVKKSAFMRFAVLVTFVSALGYPLLNTQAQNKSDLDVKAPDDIIIKRQSLMEEMYEITNEGEKPTDPAKMKSQTAAIAKKLSDLKSLFPPETNPQHPSFQASLPTYALPAIWERPEKFSQDFEANEKAVAALQQSANPPQLPELAEHVRQTCEACHSDFRAVFQSPFDVK